MRSLTLASSTLTARSRFLFLQRSRQQPNTRTEATSLKRTTASASSSEGEMKFTVTYSKNWDGGGQEFEAAKAAILAVVKNANVVPNRVDVYPITVTIEEEKLGMIYSGRQQGFFGKNGRPAMREVEEALRSKL